MVNSGQFDGLPSEEGKNAIEEEIEQNGYGGRRVTYRLRDWLISRQRYWGAPIPIIYCERCGIVPVPEKDLPVLLPPEAEFKPTGESPLKYCQSFVETTCPQCGGLAERETDTMDTFMCSSWYFLRYASPHCSEGPFEPSEMKYWLPVDQYTGGAEHAVMHLFYSRFFVKAIRDMGLVDFNEPFIRLFNQGTIVAQRQKMSKSRGNVITPDEYVNELGADAVRAYLMFIGPWDEGGEWQVEGVRGISRWLNRVWNLALSGDKSDFPQETLDPASVKNLRHLTHKTIKKVSQDLERFHFNTMLAALMEFTNYLTRVLEEGVVDKDSWREAIKTLLLVLAPTTPHLAEELWTRLGYPYSIHQQSFPIWDESLVAEEEFTIVVQVNGKLRDKFSTSVSITETEVRETALSRQKVKAWLKGQEIDKTIYVPGKLINIVTKHALSHVEGMAGNAPSVNSGQALIHQSHHP
jgi:leucyl-tRNA synthetase